MVRPQSGETLDVVEMDDGAIFPKPRVDIGPERDANDYSIWEKIVQKLVAEAPQGKESKDAFMSRLERCAKTLPKGTVKKAIGRMKSNIKAILNANPPGYIPKND